jgi:hypothetical protein
MRAAHYIVKTLVCEHHLAAPDLRLDVVAALAALESAHLEDILVVRAEANLEIGLDPGKSEIHDPHMLMARVIPQELGPEHVQDAFRDGVLAFRMDVRIHLLDHEQAVVPFHGRVQKHGPNVAE